MKNDLKETQGFIRFIQSKYGFRLYSFKIMNRSRIVGSRSFVICFYCNATFRSISMLLKHCCSVEEISSNWESLETFSDLEEIDLSQDDSAFTELVPEKSSVIPRQEDTEVELNSSSVEDTSLSSFTDTEYEKNLSETTPNSPRQEIAETPSQTCEPLSLDASSSFVEETTKLAMDTSANHLSVTNAADGQNVTEVKLNITNEFNRISPDLVSKVLQYYEKQTKQGTPNSCCKLPTEVEFQSSNSLIPIVVPDSSRVDSTMIEHKDIDVCNKGLSSETNHDTHNVDISHNKSVILKQDAKSLEHFARNMNIGPSSVRMDSPGVLSRSSSLDSLMYNNDEAESDVPEITNTSSLLQEKSDESQCEHVLVESNTSDINEKSFHEENLNITDYSKIIKPCYVKVQDIFKSLVSNRLSPQKIFSWKKKYHECDVCHKFFRFVSDLNIHHLSHTLEKPFMCNICNKSFLKQTKLLAHLDFHRKKKNYVCYVCKMAFTKNSLLVRHRLTHSKNRPYKCDKCIKSFITKSALSEHSLGHSDIRPYVCEICSASFSIRRYLRKHYYTHGTIKEYKCEFCFRTFKRKHHLEEHYNIHTNERPNQCKFCDKTFSLLLTLNRHYAVVHKIEKAIVPDKIKTNGDNKGGKNPVIQKIKKSVIVYESERSELDVKYEETPIVQNIEGSVLVVQSEGTPIIHNIEKSKADDNNKETSLVQNIEKSVVIDKCKNTPIVQNIEKSTVIDKCEQASIVQNIEKSVVIDKCKNTPMVQNIEKSTVADKCKQSSMVQNIEKSVVDKCKKIPVGQNIQRISTTLQSKGTASYSTRRKSFIPKKYLQPY